MGVFCQHAYAHITPEGIKSLPGVLKGSDTAVYSVSAALGLQVSIRPVLGGPGCFDDEEYDFDNMREDIKEIEQCGWKLGRNCVGRTLKTIVEAITDDVSERWEVVEAFEGEWLKVDWLTKPMHGNAGLAYRSVS